MKKKQSRPMEPTGASFGKEVRRRRTALGLTIEQLGVRSGLAANYVGTVENGKRDPSLSTIVALARGLEIPARDLLSDETLDLTPAGIRVATLFEQAAGPVQTAISVLLEHEARRSKVG